MKHNSAFTLVELSIVLVVLGLLVGGVLSGQALIRAAQLRAITSEYDRIDTAISSFQDKYQGLPGDLSNAQTFWPTTSNGNGDGLIGWLMRGTTESFTFWQQLAFAGLIEGSFTGMGYGITAPGDAYNGYNGPEDTADPHGIQGMPGINILASKMSNAGWFAAASDQGRDPYGSYVGNWDSLSWVGNGLLLGGPTTYWDTTAPIVTAAEAWNIDTKMDDGMPDTGAVMVLDIGSPYTVHNCRTSGTPDMYLLSNKNIACSLVFTF